MSFLGARYVAGSALHTPLCGYFVITPDNRTSAWPCWGVAAASPTPPSPGYDPSDPSDAFSHRQEARSSEG